VRGKFFAPLHDWLHSAPGAELQSSAKALLLGAWNAFAHMAGRLTKRYYFQDCVRVYPDGIVFNRLASRRHTKGVRHQQLSDHSEFYAFAAQLLTMPSSPISFAGRLRERLWCRHAEKRRREARQRRRLVETRH
jgi:hypothetical protein